MVGPSLSFTANHLLVQRCRSGICLTNELFFKNRLAVSLTYGTGQKQIAPTASVAIGAIRF